MKYLLILTLILASCSGFKINETKKPVCRHKAVYAALVFGEKYPVRIAHGPVVNRRKEIVKGKFHAQAQVNRFGYWEWLEVINGYVVVGNKDWWFIPRKHVTVEEAMKWSKRRNT